jgi:hypothetical protein
MKASCVGFAVFIQVQSILPIQEKAFHGHLLSKGVVEHRTITFSSHVHDESIQGLSTGGFLRFYQWAYRFRG